MSAGMIERQESAGGVVVRPQQSVGMTQASQRVVAEAQAALTVAKASRRDEVDAIDRIKNTCQRLGVAEKAEYSFSRGGTSITGPTIKLLEVIAGAWGNIQSGFRELSRSNGESVVEAFAWDLETNHKKIMEFTVRHWRDTKSGGHAIKEERDIYELIANMAQRRVRKCLESIIPRDVVDDALAECHKTLKAKCELTPERTKAMAEKFKAEFGVTQEQIEKRILRHLGAITQAQFIDMGRIYNSLKDGMSKAADWFEVTEEEKPAETSTDALKKKLQGKSPAPEGMRSDGEIPEWSQSAIEAQFTACATEAEVIALANNLQSLYPDQGGPIGGMEDAMKTALANKSKSKGKGDGKLAFNG